MERPTPPPTHLRKQLETDMNFIDKKFIISSLIVIGIAFLAKRYLTKTVTKPDGTVTSYVGNDAIGYA